MAKIPQDVTREDRLIGPLTLRQFLYLLGGGGLIFIAYQYYAQAYLYLIEFILISFVVGSLTLALTFANVNGRPFGLFILNFVQFLRSPKLRLWNKEITTPLKVTDEAKPVEQNPTHSPEKTATASQLELLGQVLDSGGNMNKNTSIDTNRIGSIGADIVPVEEPIVEDVMDELDK
jgi:hypothetical protein